MRLFGTARFVLSFAVAILVLLTVWIAVRAVGPAEASNAPAVVLPAIPRVTVAAPASATSKPPSRTTSGTPSPSSKTSATARTSDPAPDGTPTQKSTGGPAATTKPAPSSSSPRPPASPPATPPAAPPASPPPPARTDVEATVSVTASWSSGYMASVRVVNEGDTAVEWKVTVSHSGLENLRLRGVWGANGNLDGSTLVLTGGRLEPGRSARFGFQTSKTGRGDARPAGCNAVGGSCRVR
ncbi:cellulose binding domain-containing protein [Actinoplanes solisilvae]|uniref:cellulose binding domain-containing protein n=1 Tax=Actinoplanes solisilvae TaxID=2486853 RepID=UPI0013E2C270|nr:cellulose binding domain-containing protein [Actinoplanes solisilvae]